MMQYSKSKPLTCLVTLALLLISLSSCGSDDSPEPPINVDEARVSNISLTDHNNNDNASDFTLSFTAPSSPDITINRFMMVLMRENEAFEITGANIEALAADQIQQIPIQGTPYEIRLGADLTTVSGHSVSSGKRYSAMVITEVKVNNTIQYTGQVTDTPTLLVQEATVSTLVASLEANDALTMDNDGNLYATFYGNQGEGTKAVKIAPNGDVSTISNKLSGPLSIMYEPSGHLVVIDRNNRQAGRVRRMTMSGEFEEIVEIPGWPAGLARDGAGNIFVSNYQRPEIHKIDVQGNLSVFATDSKLRGSVGIAYDQSSNILYTSNYDNGNILKVNENGEVSLLADIELPNGVTTNFGITGYLTLLKGKLYVSGLGAHRIYSVSLTGEVELVAGSTRGNTDGTASKAQFNSPNGIVGKDNRLFVVEFGNRAVRTIDLN